MANNLVLLMLLCSSSWFGSVLTDTCPVPDLLKPEILSVPKVLEQALAWNNAMLTLYDSEFKPSSKSPADFPIAETAALIEFVQCKVRNKSPVEINEHTRILSRLVLNLTSILSSTTAAVHRKTAEENGTAVCEPGETKAAAELEKWKGAVGVSTKEEEEIGGSLASQLLSHVFYYLADKGFRKVANLSKTISRFCPRRSNRLTEAVNSAPEFGFVGQTLCGKSDACVSPGILLARIHAHLLQELVSAGGCAAHSGQTIGQEGKPIKKAMSKLAKITESLIAACTAVRPTVTPPSTLPTTPDTTVSTYGFSHIATDLTDTIAQTSQPSTDTSSTTLTVTTMSDIPTSVIQTTTAASSTWASSSAPSTFPPTTIADSTAQSTTSWPQSTLITLLTSLATSEVSTGQSTSPTEMPSVTSATSMSTKLATSDTIFTTSANLTASPTQSPSESSGTTPLTTSSSQPTSPFDTSTTVPRERTTAPGTGEATVSELTIISLKTKATSLATTSPTVAPVDTSTAASTDMQTSTGSSQSESQTTSTASSSFSVSTDLSTPTTESTPVTSEPSVATASTTISIDATSPIVKPETISPETRKPTTSEHTTVSSETEQTVSTTVLPATATVSPFDMSTTAVPRQTTSASSTGMPASSERTTVSRKSKQTTTSTVTSPATTTVRTTTQITIVPIEPTARPTFEPPGGKSAAELTPSIWNATTKGMVHERIKDADLTKMTVALNEAKDLLNNVLIRRNFYCPLGQTCVRKYANKSFGTLEDSIVAEASLLSVRLLFKGAFEKDVQTEFVNAFKAYNRKLEEPSFEAVEHKEMPTGLQFYDTQGTRSLVDSVELSAGAFMKGLLEDESGQRSQLTNVSQELKTACNGLIHTTHSMWNVFKELRRLHYTTEGSTQLEKTNKFAETVWEVFDEDASKVLSYFLGMSARIHKHRFALELCAQFLSGDNETFMADEKAKNLDVAHRMMAFFEEAYRETRERIAKGKLEKHLNSSILAHANGNLSSWTDGRFPCLFLRDPCFDRVARAFNGTPVKDSIVEVALAVIEAMAHRNLRFQTNDLHRQLETTLELSVRLTADVNVTNLPGNLSAIFNAALEKEIAEVETILPKFLSESRNRNNIYPNTVNEEDVQAVLHWLRVKQDCANAVNQTYATMANVPPSRKGQIDWDLSEAEPETAFANEKKHFRDSLDVLTVSNRSLAFLMNLKVVHQLYRMARVLIACESIREDASQDWIMSVTKTFDGFAHIAQALFNSSDSYLAREEIFYSKARQTREQLVVQTTNETKNMVDEFVGQENVGVDSGFFCDGKITESKTTANSSVEFCAQAVFGEFGSSKVLQILDQFARSTEKIWPDNYGRIRKTPVVGVFPAKILKVFKASRSSTFDGLSGEVQKQWKTALALVGRFGELVDRYVQSAEYLRKAQGDSQWVPNNATAEAIYIELNKSCINETENVKHSPILVAIKSIEDETEGFNKEMTKFTAPREAKRTLVEYWLPIAGALHASLFVADWCGALLSPDLKRERQKEGLEQAIKTALEIQKYFIGAEKYLERNLPTTTTLEPVKKI